MDNLKTALVKSKSSNSTSEAKRNNHKNDKTSKSNAEFQPRSSMCTGTQPLMLKKRGVYVEKKPTKISINNTEPSPDVPPSQPVSSPPRPIPRPSKKRFLTSVLTILSKSTAGTQFPDETEGTRKIDKTKVKHKMRSDEEDIREEWNTSPNVSRRKNKYKSRILNSQANKESFTVLQSKKDIAQTSSHNSEYINVKYDSSSVDPETMKWAESLPPLEKDDSIVSVENHSKKVRLIEEDGQPSPTMVANTPKLNDNSFYDFFVNMLKNTMTVYNVETELDKQHLPTSANSSKVTLLDIKESVARNKKIPKVEELKSQTLDISRKPSSQHAYSIMPDEKDEWTNKQLMEQFQMPTNPPAPSKKRKRKLKSDSFQYKKTSPLPKTISLPIPSKKKTTKKDPKKDFLKLLTEELELKADTYEEPENFYEALKVIARNKRRSQEWKYEVPSEEDDHVCQFKRKRVFSRKSSSKQPSYFPEPPRHIRQPIVSLSTPKKRKVIKRQNNDDSDLSNHSLAVVGYDYDYDSIKLPVTKPKNSTLSLLSRSRTPTTVLEDYSDEFWNDNSDSDASLYFEQRQIQYMLDKLGRL